MSYNGANSCDVDTDRDVVLVESQSADMESIVVLQDGSASPYTDAVISQSPPDIPHNSLAKDDLTVVSVSPAVKGTDSSTSRVSCSQAGKREVIVCKLVRHGSKFLC